MAAKERARIPHVVRINIELEDNVGSILVKHLRIIPVKMSKPVGRDDLSALLWQFILDKFPDKFEV